MENVTYIIHTRIDCVERLNNLDFCIEFLQRNFSAKIVIVEEDYTPIVAYRYRNVEYAFLLQTSPLFNRTRLVNHGARMVTTDNICLLDMDVFLDPEKYIEAVGLLKDYSIVYPFNGVFYEIPQTYNRNRNLRSANIPPKDCKMLNTDSVGGLQFIRTADFMQGGMTNEFIRGWGYEDSEFYVRFEKLGYSIYRMPNPIYHFSHPRTFNSDGRSPHIHENEKIYKMVKEMTKDELHQYIKTFPWL